MSASGGNAVRVEANDGDAVAVAAAEGAAAAAGAVAVAVAADGDDDVDDDEGCVDVVAVAEQEEVAAGRNTAGAVGADADERAAIILDLAWWPLDQLTARPERIRPQSDKSTVVRVAGP